MLKSALVIASIPFSVLAQDAAVAADAPKALSLSSALNIAQATLAACRANGYHITVTIMDPDYSTRVVLRDDAAPGFTVEVGRRKAYTALKTGMSSREFRKSLGAAAPIIAPPPPPGGPMPVIPGVNGDDHLITLDGGKAIKLNGALVGAISVSGAPGGDEDEACVDAGLAKLKR